MKELLGGFVSKQDTSYTYKSFVIIHVIVVVVIFAVEVIIIVILRVLFLAFRFITSFFGSCSFFVRLLISLAFSLLVFHIWAQDSNLIIFVFLEIKTKFLSKTELEQVVIEGLLWNSHFRGSILKRVTEQVAIWVLNPIVKFAPKGYFFYNILNSALFSTLLMWQSRNILHRICKIYWRLRTLIVSGILMRSGLCCLRSYTQLINLNFREDSVA